MVYCNSLWENLGSMGSTRTQARIYSPNKQYLGQKPGGLVSSTQRYAALLVQAGVNWYCWKLEMPKISWPFIPLNPIGVLLASLSCKYHELLLLLVRILSCKESAACTQEPAGLYTCGSNSLWLKQTKKQGKCLVWKPGNKDQWYKWLDKYLSPTNYMILFWTSKRRLDQKEDLFVSN